MLTGLALLCYTCYMKYEEREFYRLLTRAYIRDGETTHTGEAVLLATLLHAKGQNRSNGHSKDMDDVKRIMRDRNKK